MTRSVSTNRSAGIIAGIVTSVLALGACGRQEGSGAGDSPGGAAPASAPAARSAPGGGAPSPLVATGAKLYATNCAMCHGPNGQGDGAMGAGLNPRPRALAGEPWRYVKADTPEEEKAGIVKLLVEGVPGSAMPKYGALLSHEDMMALAEFVLSIRK